VTLPPPPITDWSTISEKSDRFVTVVTALRRRWVQAPTGRTVFPVGASRGFVFEERTEYHGTDSDEYDSEPAEGTCKQQQTYDEKNWPTDYHVEQEFRSISHMLFVRTIIETFIPTLRRGHTGKRVHTVCS